MNRKTYSEILDSVARDHLPANPDLAPRIRSRIQKGKGFAMQPRMKIVATVILVLLILALVLVNVPAVAAAIQHWFGYVPGFGLVREGGIRQLAAPVAVEREGITITVERALLDSEKTMILYKVENLPASAFPTDSNLAVCAAPPSLRLPDGRELAGRDGGVDSSWGTSYEFRFSYPAIPADVDRVVLFSPCIEMTLADKTPANWELPLRFVAAPPDLAAFPVIEIATPTASVSTPAPQEPLVLDPARISLTLHRAVQMDDGYLLYADLHWGNSGFDWVGVPEAAGIHVSDASGQPISFDVTNDDTTGSSADGHQTVFALKTAPIQTAGPLTLTLDSLPVELPVKASFTFDPGPDPQPGQVWELNQPVDVGYGKSLRVLKASYPTPPVKGMPQQTGLSFDMTSDTGLTGAILMDTAHPVAGGGGGGGGSFADTFSSGFSYSGDFPPGPITIDIQAVSFSLTGQWQAQWTPPVTERQASPTPQLSACLTRQSWEQALRKSIPLPAGLTGSLALSITLPPSYNYQVVVANLDGSQQSAMGFGDSPSFSPDGSRVVYTGPMLNGPPDGIYITDLATGDITQLAGTIRGDSAPLWSPDGTHIAFTRGPASGLIGAPGPYNIMLIDLDDSSLRELTSGQDANYARAWMPDGTRLLYMTAGPYGASARMMDIQTGAVSPLFDLNYNGSLAVSPDGKRLAFEEMLPLDKYGLFVSDLNGSNRRQLADGDPYIVTVPFWSPDGNWVMASVHDPDTTKKPNPMLALIGVDTCQVIPLQNLGGYIFSWLP
jgi:WD40-like Beta Propeller Repeat